MKGISLSLFFILILNQVSFAQTLAVSGKITSADGNPIPNANILAKPVDDKHAMAFAFTEEQGGYKLSLNARGSYEITVSYLGYLPQSITIGPTATPIVKNFTLQESANQLEEVVVNAAIPIIVKQDTLIYDAATFASGEERKLRELLEKMPGIQVSDEGRVTVRGKQVNKLMIEGKSFFNGTKLGINNIPADVVGKIEVYENYNDLQYLKGLEDDDVTAMNIRLKEGKSGFVFGDLEMSAGLSNRYALQPKIFYYTPERQINVISDFNNTGTKSFGIADYMAFENVSGTRGAFSYPDNDLTRFLLSKNYMANIQQFSAVNFRQQLSKKTDLNTYVIFSRNETTSSAKVRNKFPDFVESRSTDEKVNATFLMAKLSVDHRPSEQSTVLLDSYINFQNTIGTMNIFSNGRVSNYHDLLGISFKQDIKYSRKLSHAHTAVISASLHSKRDLQDDQLSSEERLLAGIIPAISDTVYNLFLQKHVRLLGGEVELKDYWILHPSHHVYVSAGISISQNKLFNDDRQVLSDGRTNLFSNSGFGSKVSDVQSDFYVGTEYKFSTGIFTFKPALFYHEYRWVTFRKSIVLPALQLKAEISKSKALELRYDLKSRIPDVRLLAPGLTIQNFNLVTQGQRDLQNERYHQVFLSYRMFDFSNFSFLNLNAQYRRKTAQAKELTQITGITQLSNYVMFYQPETDIDLNVDAKRRFGALEYALDAGYGFRNFYQFINGAMVKNITHSTSGGVGIRTMFKHAPNLNVGYHIDRNTYQFANASSAFTEHQLKAGFQWRLVKNLTADSDYVKSWYNENTFGNVNASVQLQPKNSTWSYGLVATNLLDNQVRRSNSFSALYITDSRISVLPRVIVAKLSYKL